MPQRIAVMAVAAAAASILLAASTCIPAQETKLRVYDDADGYAVLSRMLDEGWSASASPKIVISPVTGKGAQLSCAQIPDEFRSAMNDFLLLNREPFRLIDRFNTHVNFLLTDNPPSEGPEIGPGEQPVENLPLIRSGVRLSAVGFDKPKTRAIAYMTVICGSECLSAGYHLLGREKGVWNEAKGNPLCETIAQNRDAASAAHGR